jgi:glucose/arabinose dehydrogenase
MTAGERACAAGEKSMRKALIVVFVAAAGAGVWAQQRQSRPAACDPDNGGLTLPQGFCAKVVADNLGLTRHLVVTSKGDIYTVLAQGGGPLAPPPAGPQPPAVLGLRDTDGDGKYETVERFGPGLQGTGMALRDDYLYVGSNTSVVRFKLDPASLAPKGQPEVIVGDIPRAGAHSAKSIVVNGNELYVHVGSPSNACQPEDRRPGVAGQNPCSQLELHGGVWKYDANKAGQKHVAANRFTTGQRHTVAMAWNPAARQLYATQNGRDQLDSLWKDKFTPQDNNTRPAEELQLLKQGANFGWPYCFYDIPSKKRLLNPEYGGDGKAEGDCAKYDKPLAVFPAHNAPVGMMFYTGTQFPADYRNGAFITFHGSWNRTPPMDGFNIRFVPFKGETPSGPDKVFASGFAGPNPPQTPNAAAYRPVGIAQGPDGSIFVTDDVKGRIWRISYTGAR